MPEPDIAKIRQRVTQIGGAILLLLIVVVAVVLFAGAEADATPEQLAAVRKYVQFEQSAKGFENIKELGGEEQKKALKVQAARMKEMENLPIEVARVRGWGLERIVFAKLRYTADGPLQERYFTMNFLLGKWVVPYESTPAKFYRKVW